LPVFWQWDSQCVSCLEILQSFYRYMFFLWINPTLLSVSALSSSGSVDLTYSGVL
jgi:hypothetical protein